MDPLTHGLVGAALGGLVAPRAQIKAGLSAGFVSAMLADLDVLLSRADDPLFQLELHRQFSHALTFTPIGAAMALALLWTWLRRSMTLPRAYLVCSAAYASAGPLDACTSYGTQLLWPFSSGRYAFNLVAVVDPVITIGLVLALLVAWRSRRRLACTLALLWLAFWLGYGAVQQARVLQVVLELQRSRGHQAVRTVLKPTLGNQILWRATYRTDKTVFTDGVRVGPFSQPQLFPGTSAPLVLVEQEARALQGTQVYRDLQRFARLSEDFLVAHPSQPHVLGDARYAMLPTSLSPLWGVRYDPKRVGAGVTFETFRDSALQVRKELWKMLRGRPTDS